MRFIITLVVIAAFTVTSSSIAERDRVVRGVLQQTTRIAEATIWHRTPVAHGLDLVLAVPLSEEDLYIDRSFSWDSRWHLGVFLQEQSTPYRVFTVAVERGSIDCAARLLRATSTDVVLGCRDDGPATLPHQKFVYDVRAKRLVSRFSYMPFALLGGRMRVARAQRSTDSGSRALLVAENNVRRAVLAYDPATGEPQLVRTARLADASDANERIAPPPRESRGFGPGQAFRVVQLKGCALAHEPVRRGTDCSERQNDAVVIESRRGGHRRLYKLPRSTYQELATARPRLVAANPDFTFEPDEGIGPWHVDGDYLWFGRSFSDGEGSSGIGGLVRFSTRNRRFQLFVTPEVVDGSTNAIAVTPDSVWLSLEHSGEYGPAPIGIVRFDRRSEQFARIDGSDGVGRQFLAVGGDLLLLTDTGVTVIRHQRARHYFVDQTTDGRLRVAAGDK